MIITKMHWLFKERYNRSSSNYYPDYSPAQIDQLLNAAGEDMLHQFAAREDKQMFFDMMSPLLTTDVLEPVSNDGSVYKFDLSQLEKPYFYNKRIVAKTDCGSVKVNIIGHGTLNDVLADALQRPSKTWNRIYGVFQEGGITLYTDHIVDSIKIEYYRVPKPVFFGGYDTFEYLNCLKLSTNCTQFYSKESNTQDCEFDANYHTRIVDFAVREAQRTLGQQEIALTVNKVDTLLN
jgi:hypothetical protein